MGQARDHPFRDFVLDQLHDLPGLTCRSMFGGYGLYVQGVFFAILYDGRAYFRTDATSRAEYLTRGMEVFRPNDKQTLKNYYEVPAEILEDAETLCAWARAALRAR